MNVKTIAGYGAIAFLVWWVIKEPQQAQDLVVNIGHFVSNSASWLSRFVSSI